MDNIYLERRKKGNYTSYRLAERTSVIISSLEEVAKERINFVLDAGTADGIMLDKIARHFGIRRAFGIDISEGALNIAGKNSNNIRVSLGNFVHLPFKDNSFDLLLASAVIEHVEDIGAVLKESRRVLRDNGLFCVTLPNPFYDWINSRIVKTYHVRRYGLKDISRIMEGSGFKILKARHFMAWPFGRIFFSAPLLRAIRFFRLDFLLFNHITIGVKL